jgi:hypothetical protein
MPGAHAANLPDKSTTVPSLVRIPHTAQNTASPLKIRTAHAVAAISQDWRFIKLNGSVLGQ